MVTKNNSQAGFSLVELMVVVAIIGVLATIAIPRVNRFIAKSRQSEAQVNLSSLYTFNKNFYVEFQGYTNTFGAMGLKPEGALRYNVGFGDASNIPANFGALKGPDAVAAAGTTVNSTDDCAANPLRCQTLNGANNEPPGDIDAAAAIGAGNSTFTAQARAILLTDAAEDIWLITENKNLRNTSDGTVEDN